MAETARVFQLVRDRDVTGVSGTGVVADGAVWPDGTVSIRWRGDHPSTVHWACLADAETVHGHGGATRFVWAVEVERNRLARSLADARDQRDEDTELIESLREVLADRSAKYDAAAVWLDLIAERRCEVDPYGDAKGYCTRHTGRYAVARFAHLRWCDPCRAWAAQNGVPMSTQPIKSSDG